jgi:ribosomal protein S18 acetylase RimI-like enzyme
MCWKVGAKNFVKLCVTFLAGDYAPYRIYSTTLTRELPVVPVIADVEFRVFEDRDESVGIGAFVGGERISACWLWFGERYRRERNFWPLGPKEAKLVHIETSPAHRGRGLAVHLLMFAAIEMKLRGFERLFARIWHNNEASIRSFTKAGWTYQNFVLELTPLGFKRLRFVRAAPKRTA